ncbi:hypothetical protein NPIL_354221 [Nephila pilipes]|uniref:Uncharacterized protein n=1 Tax=Nephila pilipes TaxID=299642 RepID=A0A8X6TX64_NEPPI|nr:hypothetical protein NPIL_354221 [Nephila pilipes]
MESSMDEYEADVNSTVLPKRIQTLLVGDNQPEICLHIENPALFFTENQTSMGIYKIDDINYFYSRITRYLLLQTLIACEVPQPIRTFLETMECKDNLTVYKMNCVLTTLFNDDFQKMLNANEEKLSGTEIECAEFFLSRCVMLCGEPSYSSFMLVATFLSYLVLDFFNECGCFRILHITEFCFDILYRRIFQRLFQSQEDCRNLLLFCDEFNEQMEPDPKLSALLNTLEGFNLMHYVIDSINATCSSFCLTESEKEVFKKFYRIESKLPISRRLEEYLLENLERDPNYVFHRVKSCDSKCYNYLVYVTLYS